MRGGEGRRGAIDARARRAGEGKKRARVARTCSDASRFSSLSLRMEKWAARGRCWADPHARAESYDSFISSFISLDIRPRSSEPPSAAGLKALDRTEVRSVGRSAELVICHTRKGGLAGFEVPHAQSWLAEMRRDTVSGSVSANWK